MSRVVMSVSLAIAVAGCDRAAASGAVDIDALPRLALAEEVRIGSASDPDSGFSSIADVDVDRDGNVYVFEAQAMEFRVFDRDGRFLRKIGRRGTGPGEFEDQPLFGIVGDTVWASNVGGRQLTLFDRSGRLLGTNRVAEVQVQMHNPGEVGYVLPFSMRADGLFDGRVMLYTGGGSNATSASWPVQSTDTVLAPRVLFNGDGVPVDTIGWDKIPPRESRLPARVRVGSRSYGVPQPPPATGLATRLPDGMVTVTIPPDGEGDRREFTVTRVRADSDTVYVRRLAWSPQPYRDAELDSLAWRIARRMNVMQTVNGVTSRPPAEADSMAAFTAIRAEMRFPEHRPPVIGMYANEDGSVWLSRGDDGAGSTRWIVLDPAGNVRGGVALPRQNRLVWGNGDMGWMIAPDDVDVPWLVRYRVERAG